MSETDQPNLAALYGSVSNAETFLGLERCENLDELEAPIALLGVPFATPYASVGGYCRNGPAALRKATEALAFNIECYDFELDGQIFPTGTRRAVDCGDLTLIEDNAASNRDAIRKAVSMMLSRGAIPVLLGGDDSIPIPMIEALGEHLGDRKITILQIDAHIDWRDEHLGETMGLSSTMRRASEMPHVERIIQVGSRGIGTARSSDYQAALDWGVQFIGARHLHRDGVDAALNLIPEGSDIVVCIDADAMDPSLVPGVIGRAPGGLTYFQMVDLVMGAARRGRILAMDFVEFMPERDVDGLGAFTFARVITTALGVLARQGHT